MSQESFGDAQYSVNVSRCSSESVLIRGACGIRRPTWQFNDEEMEKTPSVLDGMTLHEERQYRRDACEFVVLFAREINKQMRLSGVSVDERLYVSPLLLDMNSTPLAAHRRQNDAQCCGCIACTCTTRSTMSTTEYASSHSF